MAEAVAAAPGFSVVGGGDSASALEDLGLSDQVELPLHRGRGLPRFIESATPGLTCRGHRRPARAPNATPGVSGARRPLVSGNWKMHHDHIEALHTVRDLGLRLKPDDVARVDVSVHPPFTDLRTVQTLVEKERHPGRPRAPSTAPTRTRGPTGEVSPACWPGWTRYVIVGHSERRSSSA